MGMCTYRIQGDEYVSLSSKGYILPIPLRFSFPPLVTPPSHFEKHWRALGNGGCGANILPMNAVLGLLIFNSIDHFCGRYFSLPMNNKARNWAIRKNSGKRSARTNTKMPGGNKFRFNCANRAIRVWRCMTKCIEIWWIIILALVWGIYNPSVGPHEPSNCVIDHLMWSIALFLMLLTFNKPHVNQPCCHR